MPQDAKSIVRALAFSHSLFQSYNLQFWLWWPLLKGSLGKFIKKYHQSALSSNIWHLTGELTCLK